MKKVVKENIQAVNLYAKEGQNSLKFWLFLLFKKELSKLEIIKYDVRYLT